MKIRIEIDDNIDEDEIIINCREFDKNIEALHKSIKQVTNYVNLIFYKNNIEYYFSLSEVLFFESGENNVFGHTAHDIYQIKNKLYELQELLPNNFVRISKSTIININYIFSIDRKLASSSCISLKNTHKQVYVSRAYFKELKTRLNERRNYEK